MEAKRHFSVFSLAQALTPAVKFYHPLFLFPSSPFRGEQGESTLAPKGAGGEKVRR
jgi:hypothetical protein